VSSTVFDASAALALLQHEPGNDVVKRHVPGAFMSAVNVAEVGTKLVERGMDLDQVHTAIATLGLEIVAFDEETAYASAILHGRTRASGLSLGDRACLALAEHMNLPALTADRMWTKVDVGVEVRLIRE
jgi:ribonuclease VapC